MGSKSAKNNSSSKPKECFDLFSDEHTGDPFQFNVDIDDVECRHKIVKAIQKFGGVVTDSPEEKERRIRLVDPDSRKIYRKEDGEHRQRYQGNGQADVIQPQTHGLSNDEGRARPVSRAG